MVKLWARRGGWPRPPLLVVLLLALLASLASADSVPAPVNQAGGPSNEGEVPDLVSQMEGETAEHEWLVSRSKQTLHLDMEHSPAEVSVKSWQVTEYMRLNPDAGAHYGDNLQDMASISLWSPWQEGSASRNQADPSFSLATIGTRLYRMAWTEGRVSECWPEHNPDHLARWPWRHWPIRSGASYSLKHLRHDCSLLGVGALWLNAVQSGARCFPIANKKMMCKVHSQGQAHVELVFGPENGQRAASDNQRSSKGLLRILEGSVKRINSLHELAGDDILQDSELEFQVQTMMGVTRVESELEAKLAPAISKCRQSLFNADFVFPSLMNELAISQRRAYRFLYQVRQPIPVVSGQQMAEYKVQESFSYERQVQVFQLRPTLDGAEGSEEVRLHRMLTTYKRIENRTRVLTYKIRTDSGQPVGGDTACRLLLTDQDFKESLPLVEVGPFMERKLRFTRPGRKGNTSWGILQGLGALLMNLADVRHKHRLTRRLAKQLPSQITGNYQLVLEWVVELAQNRTLMLLFKKEVGSKGLSLEASMDDLLWMQLGVPGQESELEIQVLAVALGSVPDTVLGPLNENSEFVTPIGQFVYPPINNFGLQNTNEPLLDSSNWWKQEETVDDGDSDPEVVDDDDDEFPKFAQQLGIEGAFELVSRWNFDNGTSLLIKEAQLYKEELKQPVLRLDLERSNENSSRKSLAMAPYSLFIVFATGTMYHVVYPSVETSRDREASCEHVSSAPDSWLHLLSAPSGFHQRKLGGNKKFPNLIVAEGESDEEVEQEMRELKKDLPFLGLASLWKLASDSSFIQRVGPRNSKSPQSWATWQLSDEPILQNLVVLFNFSIPSGAKTGSGERPLPILHSVYIDTEKQPELFGGVKSIQVESINMSLEVEPEQLELPSSCTKLENHVDLMEKARPDLFPRFEKRNYELGYSLLISSTSQSHLVDTLETRLVQDDVRLLQLRIGKNLARIWLEYGNNVVLEREGLCRQLTRSLSKLFQLDKYLELFGNSEEMDQSSDYAILANLWRSFQHRMDHNLSSIEMLESSIYRKGREIPMFEWQLRGSGTMENRTIKFSFQEDKHWSATIPTSSNLKLAWVSLTDETGPNQGPEVQIVMEYMSDRAIKSGSLKGPFDCLVGPDFSFDPTGSQGSSPMPSMSEALKEKRNGLSQSSGIILIRSELVLGSTTDNLDESGARHAILTELIDEHQAYELRTSGLVRDLRHLIYENSNEWFDLSREYNCPGGEAKSRLNEGLLGAGQLWWQAEKAEASKIADNRKDEPADLLDLLGLVDRERLEDQIRWLQGTRSWIVTLHEPINIQYRLQFWPMEWMGPYDRTSQQRKDPLSQLRRVEVSLNLVLPIGLKSFTSVATKVPVIISPEWTYQVSGIMGDRHVPEFRNRLLIPKGYGCKRSSSVLRNYMPVRDALIFESSSPCEFHYEAVFRSMKPGLPPRMQTSPTIHSGWLGRCPAKWDLVSIGAIIMHKQRSHHLNGQISSRRLVLSQEPTGAESPIMGILMRELDEMTGISSIKRLANQSGQAEFGQELLRLHFGSPDPRQHVVISESQLRSLLSNNKEVQMIQHIKPKPGSGEVEKLVYETLQTKPFSLGDPQTGNDWLFDKPVYIVRTFERPVNRKNSGLFIYHSSALIEAIVPNKAHLTLRIHGIGYRDCLDMVEKKAEPEDWAQSSQRVELGRIQQTEGRSSSLRSFQMVYLALENGSEMNQGMFEEMRERLASQFRSAIIEVGSKNQLISPMQFGHLQLTYENRLGTERGFLVHFNLLEPPQPIEYFEMLPDSKGLSMKDLRESVTKPLESEWACSNWCAKLSCSAFTYCITDRACQLQINPQNDGSSRQDADLEPKELGGSPNQDAICHRWRAPGWKPRPPLDRLVAILEDDTSAQVGELRKTLDLNIWSRYGQIVFRVADFRELGIFNNDPSGTIAKNLGELEQGGRYQDSYIKLRSKRKLVINNEENSLVWTQERMTDLMACMNSCQRKLCNILSYCSHDRICTILSNLTSGLQYQQAVSSYLSEQSDCTVFSEDYLLDYSVFANTSPPKEWSLTRKGMSLEDCAAACRLESTIDCLSFDYCFNGVESNCFLQQMHLEMGDFDHSILDQKLDSNGKQRTGNCSHYSRSLLADYWMQPNSRFAQHNSLILKGTQLEICALICRRNENCEAFEYCLWQEAGREPQSFHLNSCYMHKTAVSYKQSPDQLANQAADKHLDRQFNLTYAEDCSVYRRAQSLADSANAQEGQPSSSREKPRPSPSLVLNLALSFAFATASLILGIGTHFGVATLIRALGNGSASIH